MDQGACSLATAQFNEDPEKILLGLKFQPLPQIADRFLLILGSSHHDAILGNRTSCTSSTAFIVIDYLLSHQMQGIADNNIHSLLLH
jgi:hypothetical protein